MASSPLVSIIIPMYNMEQYISKCLDSVVSQTYKSIEVIVVNDGSEDSSQQIVRGYARQHPNLTCMTIPNGGVSNARNVGLDACNGDYVQFLDADDFIDSSMIEELVNLSDNGSVDLVVSGIKTISEDSRVIGVLNATSHSEEKYSEGIDPLVHHIPLYLHNHFIARKAIKNIRFDGAITLLEDRDFLWKVYSNSNSIAMTNKAYYSYVERSGSAIRTTSIQAYEEALKVVDDIYRDEVATSGEKLALNSCIHLRITFLNNLLKSRIPLQPYSTFISEQMRWIAGKISLANGAPIQVIKYLYLRYMMRQYV